ncbi:Nucleoid-associated protein YgaU, contains BON and LysM domains [Palleronia marisminoris]|uniref:LysM domain/BON superfamily protein n=1 Tax=Palleronia marisminoris TaxID=315423 RepID=A0A1Y5T947_9RHOB|nr:LysM peptidoglycan-binding domain-containing protein [Palleronia marisminoris]SFH23332.1 Nucleoid-associated protein YgaU, contains BON and LysM domains [Palleronia marisminoris]SLN58427.1 LysM domain/BON superfamily protein [Palleronia marisminoris]
MTRLLGMVFGCVIAAGLLVLGLRFAPGVEVVSDGAGEDVAAVVVPEPAVVVPAEDDADGPEVDVLRVERDGAMLVSGRATPGAQVEVLLGEQMAGTVSVDVQGNFVAFLDLPESEAPQSLNLRERDGGEARPGKQSFVIEPRRPAPPGPAPEAARIAAAPAKRDLRAVAVEDRAAARMRADVAAEDPEEMRAGAAATLVTPETSAPVTPLSVPDRDMPVTPRADASGPRDVPVATDRPDAPRIASLSSGPAAYDAPPVTPEVQDVMAQGSRVPVVPRQETFAARLTTPPVTEPPSRPEAPRVLQVENGGLSVVQDGAPRPALSIDTIRYAPDGTVVLGGRAPEAASVRVYLDNRPLDAVRSEADGQWRLDMPALAERTYTLRVDQLDATGEVTARAETPFRPESAASLDALQGMVEDGVRRVTVQPGFTLWAIAESNYGDGMSFVRVFEANADKIGNPDLIYPGQIFAVPD